jgi:pyruvate/2-oxoglutarate dehydrogenase complex dihydrolipoamide dehydrogenase (E3) component
LASKFSTDKKGWNSSEAGMFDVIVVGEDRQGKAALRQQLGARVALVERDRLGGTHQ